MNEEYLWDKTGCDEEIEAFETALSVFKHDCDAKFHYPVETSKANAFFSAYFLKWAIPAFVFLILVVSIFLGARLFNSESTANSVAQINKEISPTKVEIAQNDSKNTQSKNTRIDPTENVASAKPHIAKRTIQTKAKFTVINARTFPVTDRTRAKKYTEKSLALEQVAKAHDSRQPEFTDEEIAAYNKLRQALAITGKNLRAVSKRIQFAAPFTPDTGKR